ncbi:sigma-70 family RNA polymerase sigma factor [Gemelliphila palaticanis]|uniref:Sigma-70 family RNA polymerase sigma factor n=1 Tax=Gemelliphila palaticanis TaxID=81950 RepID=A0ABX2T0B6_9BACL|nr:sigma-70 family RNA polymerase sigma factor [Gemella palaticanis]MBF0715882.1 sigma-70 family RNA polymerase sigma factor [Gemella palaticanis]NYS47812.1 sigma-70 family RNA polymerase sigma factor [Gemella palaticanis]
MDYKLTYEQELKFNDLVNTNKEKIKLAMYKCNILPRNYNEFYNYALEGLLVSFIMLEEGVIKEEDFERFSFVTMKRKIIDELRSRSRHKYSCLDEIENLKLFESKEYNIEERELFLSVESILNSEEKQALKYIIQGYDYKLIFEKMNISKSKGYNIINSLKSKCNGLVYNF